MTIESKEGYLLTLDYPNREVLDSIASMYLNLVYKIDGYALLGNEIWKALREGDLPEVVRLYDVALNGIHYDGEGRKIISSVLVADDDKKQIII